MRQKTGYKLLTALKHVDLVEGREIGFSSSASLKRLRVFFATKDGSNTLTADELIRGIWQLGSAKLDEESLQHCKHYLEQVSLHGPGNEQRGYSVPFALIDDDDDDYDDDNGHTYVSKIHLSSEDVHAVDS
eukprot:3754375-Amphidinium_carterae.2